MTELEPEGKIEQLEQAIAALITQRAVLGDEVVEAAIDSLRHQLAEIEKSEPKPSPVFEGERKLVTVMFADISGFTALSETMDPEAVRELMNNCFSWLVPVVEKYEGTVDKFIGDEIMVLFGAPVAHENDTERALRAALEMMETLATFNQAHNIDLGMHIGINTGPVIAGGIGSEGRQQYSVMGDTVNLAARLEDASERGQIFVGSDTHRLSAPLFDFEPLESILVKGKSEPVKVYRLKAVKAVPGAVHEIAGLRSTMVGRDAELRQLQAVISDLRDGRGGVVSIIGEAGLGKSRLVAEARSALPAGHTWVEGRAFSHTQDTSYWIARDLLRGLLGVETDSPLAEISAAFQDTTGSTIPDSDREDMWLFLAYLLDLPLDGAFATRIAQFGPRALQERIPQAFSDYLRARSRQPLVLLWEDLHWADHSSLKLLNQLLPLTAEVSLLLLLVFRPDKTTALAAYRQISDTRVRDFHAIELYPLNRDDSVTLLQSLLRIDNLPDRTRALLLDKADGNPLFLEELLRSLIDMGMVRLQGDRAVATGAIHDLKVINVPDTVQGVIAARIDLLPANDKHTLQRASVIGRSFQKQVLRTILEDDPAGTNLDASLETLWRLDFIRPHQAQVGENVSEDQEYIFKHVLTQETAYNSLLIAQRKVLHKEAGEAIETLFSERLEELSATLAYHFEHAGAPDRALAYLLRAGERAVRLSANQEAVGHFRRGLELIERLPDTPDRAGKELAFRVSLAVALTSHRGYADREAEQAYAQAYRLCEQIGDTRQLRTVVGLMGGFYLVKAKYGQAIEVSERLTAIALRRKGTRLLLLVSNYLQAECHCYMGRLEDGLEHAQQAIASYSPRLHRAMILSSNFNLAVASRCSAALSLHLLGHPDRGRHQLDQAFAMAEEVAHPLSLAYALTCSAIIAQLGHNVPTAHDHAEKAIALSVEYGNPVLAANGTITQGWAIAMQGQAVEGLVQIRQGLAQYQATGSEYLLSAFLIMLAEACQRAGQLEEGLAALDDAAAFSERTGERFCQAELHRLRGELLLELDSVVAINNPSPESQFLQAIKVARQRNTRFWELRATMSLCRLWAKQGKQEEARPMLEEIYKWFREGFGMPDLREAKLLLEELPIK